MKKIDGIRVRLNPATDIDIIEDLQKAGNMTERVKELYRKALKVEEVPNPPFRFIRITHNGEILFEDE